MLLSQMAAGTRCSPGRAVTITAGRQKEQKYHCLSAPFFKKNKTFKTFKKPLKKTFKPSSQLRNAQQELPFHNCCWFSYAAAELSAGTIKKRRLRRLSVSMQGSLPASEMKSEKFRLQSSVSS